jgi:hypothetical protein
MLCYAFPTVQAGTPMTVPGDDSPIGPPKSNRRRVYVFVGSLLKVGGAVRCGLRLAPVPRRDLVGCWQRP